jgi:putative endonuclease
MNNYIVYLIFNTSSNKTYIGMTNNPERRIRQHNGDLVGGARYTTANKGEGEWQYYGYIDNLDKRMALSIEKKIQIKSRKMKGSPLERRIKAIDSILENYDKNFIYLVPLLD